MRIPAGAFLPGFEADLFGGVGLQKVEGEMAQDGEVFGGVTGADPALVFAEADIERPMQ